MSKTQTSNRNIIYTYKKRSLASSFFRQGTLQVMALLGIAWFILFCYVPMFGLQIAFKDYIFNKGILHSPFVGLFHFKEFFTDPYIGGIIKNTLGISLLKVIIGFPLPIIFAILLNEVGNLRFKRVVQTISYFPYFISWVIVSVMAVTWLSPSSGFVNSILVSLHILKEPYFFLGQPEAFWWIALALDIWKNIGFSSNNLSCSDYWNQ